MNEEKKAKIDKFIGEIPVLAEKASNSLMKMQYWLGYRDAKREVRDRFYTSSGVVVEKTQKLENPVEIFDGEIPLPLKKALKGGDKSESK